MIRAFGDDAFRRFQTVDARQIQIHKHQVGSQRLDDFNRVLTCLCFTDHLEAARHLDHIPSGHAERLLIVDDHDTDGRA
jgi:hypothetical protein